VQVNPLTPTVAVWVPL